MTTEKDMVGVQNASGTRECINIFVGKHGYKGRKDKKEIQKQAQFYWIGLIWLRTLTSSCLSLKRQLTCASLTIRAAQVLRVASDLVAFHNFEKALSQFYIFFLPGLFHYETLLFRHRPTNPLNLVHLLSHTKKCTNYIIYYLKSI
jgi:hypothetical protein